MADHPAKLGTYTPETLKRALEGKGCTVKPLLGGNYTDTLFEEGGGYKVNFGGDGILMYHPEERSHHKIAYYKISTGKGGTRRYDMDGNEKSADNILNSVNNELAVHYDTSKINGESVFLSEKNKYFRPFTIWDWKAIGIEYAYEKKEAELNRYEDGDLFYLDDYDSIDALMKDILQEIEHPGEAFSDRK